MNRHEFLAALHEVVRPRTYLEIGVSDGRSLALSRVPSIAIDPAYRVTSEVCCDVHLARTTSDEFFAQRSPLAHLPHPVVDLAFIDGMHLAEFALRDFMNVERWTASTSVVVFDDMLPRNVDEAARDRHTGLWTGDVYKVMAALRRLRPDLVLFDVATEGSGVAVVLLPDAGSSVLSRHYGDLVAEMVVPDPQDVPGHLIRREAAVTPESLVGSPVWTTVRHLRDRRRPVDRMRVADVYAGAGIAPLSPQPVA